MLSRIALLRRDQPTIDQRSGRNVLIGCNDAVTFRIIEILYY